MKLQVVVPVKGLNVEHRMMMTLRFIDLKLYGKYSLQDAIRHRA